jgi:hypothetical protein
MVNIRNLTLLNIRELNSQISERRQSQSAQPFEFNYNTTKGICEENLYAQNK